MKTTKFSRSYQISVDFINCDFNLVKFNYFLTEIKKILKINKIKFIKYLYHTFKKNNGTTIVFILSNSHLSIHTWPEKNLVNLDLFICNFTKNYHQQILNSYKDFKKLLKPKKTIFKKIIRIT
ncbi:MAG: hypothetical protein KatS3mg094_125 [Candidatus Parcubacteria bacterium]|nr:MAG: hypothetical protein KatS3mg094_125 [Candidatus Parcubacteria bacterium]